MDEQVLSGMASGFCGQLKSFISSLHNSTAQLRATMSLKPPAYADLSSFLLDFNDRLAEDCAQMDLLEEMTVENVSFEELLAHCMELYKQNDGSIASLETQLQQFGYAKDRREFLTHAAGESGAGGEEKQTLDTSFVEGLKQRVRAKESSPRGSTEFREDVLTTPSAEQFSSFNSSGSSYARFEAIRSSAAKGRLQSNLASSYQSPLPSALAQSKLDSDDLSKLGDSFSLEDFGISASSLASLAMADIAPITSEEGDFPTDQKQAVISAKALSEICSDDMDESCDASPPDSPTYKGSEQLRGVNSPRSSPFLGLFTDEEYNQVQSWLRNKVSLKELNDAIEKINHNFHITQKETLGSAHMGGKQLELEESFLLGLGSKMKSALFILVQQDKLVVAYDNACTYYRPSELAKFR